MGGYIIVDSVFCCCSLPLLWRQEQDLRTCLYASLYELEAQRRARWGLDLEKPPRRDPVPFAIPLTNELFCLVVSGALAQWSGLPGAELGDLVQMHHQPVPQFNPLINE